MADTKTDGNSQLLWVLLIVFLLVMGGGIPGFGPTAPFKVEQPSALVIEETEQRTTDFNLAVAMYEHALPGHFRKLDKDNPPLEDEQWVKDAWAVWEKAGKQVPWVVGANKATGFSHLLNTKDLPAVAKDIATLGK